MNDIEVLSKIIDSILTYVNIPLPLPKNTIKNMILNYAMNNPTNIKLILLDVYTILFQYFHEK
jgi:hypothetical protein